MRPAKEGSCYEYIAVYVNDLAIAPKKITDQYQNKHNFKLKGTEPLTHHLEKILESYERTLGSKPHKGRPPLEESDHHELDTSELCHDVEIHQ